jgi:Transposase and inactivated derivatives
MHMLVSIPTKLSVSSFMGYLKGKSLLMIFDRHGNFSTSTAIGNFSAEDIMLTL